MWLLVLSAIVAQPQPVPVAGGPANPLYSPAGIDHVLVWTPDIDRATSALAVRLGFQVRPGGSFDDGSANRLVRFPDDSFLELLYFTRPAAQLSGDAVDDYRFTHSTGGGANSFALSVDDVDATQRFLSHRGIDVATPEPMAFDLDGDGPKKPIILWKTAEFPKAPLTSSDLFFIHYSLPTMSPQRAADEQALTRHPNGAIGISAIWLLSSDLRADRESLERMGFHAGEPVRLPLLAASGVRFDTAREAVILLQPDGPGIAANAVAARGAHIYGISIAVSDLGRAQRTLEHGYGETLRRYEGPMGEAVSAPSSDDLGLVIEFHQAKQLGLAGTAPISR